MICLDPGVADFLRIPADPQVVQGSEFQDTRLRRPFAIRLEKLWGESDPFVVLIEIKVSREDQYAGEAQSTQAKRPETTIPIVG
jgi:hypothetical protein